TAEALDISEANVKTTLHRARRVLADYDTTRRPPTREVQEATRSALERLLAALAREDVAAVEECLAESARSTSDAAGEFHAAVRTVLGRTNVARLFLGLSRKSAGVPASFELRSLNGLPALVIAFEGVRPGFASKLVVRCEVDADGRIVLLESIL